MSSLAEQLQTLQTLDLIKTEKNSPNGEYAFKHVFTQESVYKSLLRSERCQLHCLVGEILEAAYADDLEDVALMLAHHFELGEDTERALKYLKIAATNAGRAYANEEARILYERILNLLPEDDYAGRWDVFTNLEPILNRLGERERQASALTIMQTLADLTGDTHRLTLTYQRRAIYFDRISKYQASAEAARVSLRLAHQCGDDQLIAQSFNLLAQAAWRRFQYEEVQKWANQALDALRLAGAPHIRIPSLLHLGRASYRLGQYDAALSYIQAALTLAAQTDDRADEALCHLILGWIYQRLGDYDTAERQFQLDLEKRRAIGDRYGEAEALSHLGWVAYDQGAYQNGLRYCQEALVLSRAIEDRENEAYALSGLGLALEGLGNHDQAKDFYQQALTLHRAIEAQTLVMFDLSRLAKLALEAGDELNAYSYTNEIIAWTSRHGTERFWDPWLIHYNNYRVMQANERPEQAQAILEEAYTLLQKRAERISDPGLRRCFLKNVKINRLIAEAWEQSQRD